MLIHSEILETDAKNNSALVARCCLSLAEILPWMSCLTSQHLRFFFKMGLWTLSSCVSPEPLLVTHGVHLERSPYMEVCGLLGVIAAALRNIGLP